MFQPKIIGTLRNYSWKQFRPDFNAGIVVGMVALPLAMAFAIASGVGPERGIYTAIVAGFLISALGGCKVQIGGPTGAFVVIVAGIMEKFGYDGLMVATILAGIFLILMGAFRFGSMVKFIPYPVVTGFTSGIAVIIFSSQMKDFLGLNIGTVPTDFVAKWGVYFQNLGTLNLWALAISLFTVACIVWWPKAWHKVPGPIAALVLASAITAWFNLPVETIRTRFGGIPHGLPSPSFPHVTWELVRLVMPSAVTVAFLAAVESLLSAVVADGMINDRHKSNTELIAQGIANIVAPVFGGIPATGAIARTATNIKNGGRTPVAGIVHALALLVILLAAHELAAQVPLACLAGVLTVVSYNMSGWRNFRSMLSAPRSDIAVLVTTFLLTVFIDLTVAVEVGMILAAFLFMRKMVNLTQVKVLTRDMDDPNNGDEDGHPFPNLPEGVEVYSIQGTFSFGAANKLLELDRITSQRPKVIVLEMSGVLYMDATGLYVLDKLHEQCTRANIRLVIVGIHTQPLTVMEKADKLAKIGENNLKSNMDQLLKELLQTV